MKQKRFILIFSLLIFIGVTAAGNLRTTVKNTTAQNANGAKKDEKDQVRKFLYVVLRTNQGNGKHEYQSWIFDITDPNISKDDVLKFCENYLHTPLHNDVVSEINQLLECENNDCNKVYSDYVDDIFKSDRDAKNTGHEYITIVDFYAGTFNYVSHF